MKVFFLLFLCFFFLSPTATYANGAGLPPFFTINDKLATSNPLQSYGITASSFLIPQDFAPEQYLVNQSIHFAIDESQLKTVIAEDYLLKTKFVWDYGDGEKAEGLINEHSYKHIGSYILQVTINVYSTDTAAPTQFIDSFLVNVIPEENFHNFPQAIIRINGKQVKDPMKEILDFNYDAPFTFDATKSQVPSGKIVEYLWNFGDGQTSNKPVVKHTYNNKDFKVVVLQIKDKNGFISDGFVSFSDSSHLKQKETSHLMLQVATVFGGAAGVILLILIFLFFKKKKDTRATINN